MHAAAGRCAPFRLTIAGAGTFPPGPRPRTLWLGLHRRDRRPWASCRAALGEALVGAGWPADGRPFRPHLTLARSDGLAAGPLVAAAWPQRWPTGRSRADIERIGLFESVTGGGPARYVPVDDVPLGGDPAAGESVYHPT